MDVSSSTLSCLGHLSPIFKKWPGKNDAYGGWQTSNGAPRSLVCFPRAYRNDLKCGRRKSIIGIRKGAISVVIPCQRECMVITRAHREEERTSFKDFLEFSSSPHESKPESAEEKAQELIDRTSSLLKAAKEALQEVRSRDPPDSKHRQLGGSISNESYGREWRGRMDHASMIGGATVIQNQRSPVNKSSTSRVDVTSSIARSGQFGDSGVDEWFRGKVDTGSVQFVPSPLAKTTRDEPRTSIAVMERPNYPSSLEFASQHDISDLKYEETAESLGMVFQNEIIEEEEVVTPEPEIDKADEKTSSMDVQHDSGEEFGPDGYWYRWNEIQGRDSSGNVQWYEKWWEISDWKGMKELGAEKWGFNAKGDAWRETWHESIGFDPSSHQPTVERWAHKWARSLGSPTYQEWEEKWGETYWSGGKAEKWADKWGKDGDDCWHEKWGESYNGHGGCVKWTDRWAERPPENCTASEGINKWGEKWEERFESGKGSKRGESWSEDSNGHRYDRWWGENHFGDGFVQKFGHSTDGEHWDTTEQQDTYYNPIPHFGYDLALAHSPQLKGVPILPRDNDLNKSSQEGTANLSGNAIENMFTE